jgi:hypothetical protein
MTRFLSALLFLGVAVSPALAGAQGGRGAFGRGRGRSQPGQGDTTAAGAPRPQLGFAAIVLAHRAQLQLTDSQATKIGDIRMVAISKRAQLGRTVDSVRAAMVVSPSDSIVAATDSSRREVVARRRVLGAMLGALHDVDVDARDETLALLTSDQQAKAELLEELTDSPSRAGTAGAPSGRGGRGGRGGGGRGGAGSP